MPLEPGSSREVISRNIAREMRRGHPQRQAIAMAMRSAGISRRDALDMLDEARDAIVNDSSWPDQARDSAGGIHIHVHR
jgi:hypothetical protein